MKKLIKELEGIRGRHTELISVYIPSGYNLAEVVSQLIQEKSTAENIKSKTTRKNVLGALEKILQHLKLFRKTPPHGLIIFCGNVSPEEGRSDIRLWSFEPPEKLKVKMYWCGQNFVLDPLKDMVKEKEIYGLIVLDASEATIGMVKGRLIEKFKRLESTVPSKTVKGGMSQARYDRIREDAINEFLTKVGEIASRFFLEIPELNGILVGGPGVIKELLVKKDYLHYKLKKKILGMVDTSYTDEYGLEELVKKSKDLIKSASIIKEKDLLDKFFAELKKGGNVSYGYYEVKKALEAGAIDTLLISEEFDWYKVKFECGCGNEEEVELPEHKIKEHKCKKCGKVMEVIEKKDLVEMLIEEAKNYRTKVEFISTNTSEGLQFKQLGGIGALLRFKFG